MLFKVDKAKLVLFLFGLGEKPTRCHRCQAQSKPVYRGPHNSTLKFTAGKDIDHACLFDKYGQLKGTFFGPSYSELGYFKFALDLSFYHILSVISNSCYFAPERSPICNWGSVTVCLSMTVLESELKEQCHKDFAVLGQFCAKIITSRLES